MTDAPLVLTPQQVAERLGVRLPTLRRHATTIEAITGEALPRGQHLERLWPELVVKLLAEALGMVHRHEAVSVEGALRALTSPLVPLSALDTSVLSGVAIGRDDLAELLREALAPSLLPIMAALERSQGEVEILRRELAQEAGEAAAARAEMQAMRGQLARLEVTAHAALPPATAEPQPTGLRGLVIRLLGG
ncbi:hypothetical protein [Deinococcus frigens]|uniref:hypothetical protein n=1 Tax=Deinococcus frigens TaxID=249403 RepID=UPI00049837E7|nr:hypothetical protein [Deinococcus frigens]